MKTALYAAALFGLLAIAPNVTRADDGALMQSACGNDYDVCLKMRKDIQARNWPCDYVVDIRATGTTPDGHEHAIVTCSDTHHYEADLTPHASMDWRKID